jgi:hypothetical protein
MSDQYPPPSGQYPPPSGNDPYNQPGPPQYGQDPISPPPYGSPQPGPPQYGQDPISSPPYGSPQSGPPQYGQDPSGPPGYGPPGQDPSAPPFGAPYAAPGGAPVPPKKSKAKIVLIILAVVAVLAIVCCVGVFVFARDQIDEALNGGASNAQAGDCLAGSEIDDSGTVDSSIDLEVVDCGDATAKYEVLGRLDNVSQTETLTNDEACAAYPDATSVIWVGTDIQDGTGLCLKAK